ncbi:MAG TPA: archease [Thermodesulfovibrionales bacterium]|nr:archease [Thermodesulfovibrionales bacterium]
MEKFEVVDISGDAGIRAYGATLADVFINTAMGMYSLITDPEGIGETNEINVAAESPSLEGLLVAWLNELIFHFDTYGFIGRKIMVERLENHRIAAKISGEDFDPERHERRLLIKAATYHQLSVGKKEGHWVAHVIFDI